MLALLSALAPTLIGGISSLFSGGGQSEAQALEEQQKAEKLKQIQEQMQGLVSGYQDRRNVLQQSNMNSFNNAMQGSRGILPIQNTMQPIAEQNLYNNRILYNPNQNLYS